MAFFSLESDLMMKIGSSGPHCCRSNTLEDQYAQCSGPNHSPVILEIMKERGKNILNRRETEKEFFSKKFDKSRTNGDHCLGAVGEQEGFAGAFTGLEG